MLRFLKIMKTLNIRQASIVAALTVFCVFPVFAQQLISNEKLALIKDYRELTGTVGYSASVDSKSVTSSSPLASMVDQDKELTDEQKVGLKKFAAEGEERIAKAVMAFFNDKETIQRLFEDVANKLIDRNLTEDELRDAISFYKTPTGQKSVKLQAAFSTKLSKEFDDAFGQQLKVIIASKLGVEVDELKKRIREARNKKDEG